MAKARKKIGSPSENIVPSHNHKFYSQYTPHPWLAHQHLMTIAAELLPRGNSVLQTPFEPLFIPVDSQSVVRADAHVNPANKSCLIIVHGLEGSSSSPYVLGLAARAMSTGLNVVRLNLRNCGGTLHLTPTLYNAGQSDDLQQVINWLAQQKGQENQYLVGYSLGGNLVLKALAESGGSCSEVKAACVVSPSIDLAASVRCLSLGINKIYEVLFLRSLRIKIKQKCRLFPQLYDVRRLTKVNSLFAFDDLYTAPDAGYPGAIQYYHNASSYAALHKIKTPVLIITAQDDPLVPFDSFTNIDNPHLYLLAPEHGGHVGFLADGKNNSAMQSGSKHDLYWADSQILHFISNHTA